jgi:hypothetical protein
MKPTRTAAGRRPLPGRRSVNVPLLEKSAETSDEHDLVTHDTYRPTGLDRQFLGCPGVEAAMSGAPTP